MTHDPPRTYAEWSDLIDAFGTGQGDEGVIAAMKEGALPWDPDLSRRFLDRYLDAVGKRLDLAMERFDRAIDHAGDPGVLTRALRALRRDFARLFDAADLPVFPDDVRETIRKSIRDQAAQVQRDLSKDATGRLGQILRQNPVDTF